MNRCILRRLTEVARDVRDDKVSLAAAREQYGVVLDEDTLAVDLDATATLRNRRVSSRSQGLALN